MYYVLSQRIYSKPMRLNRRTHTSDKLSTNMVVLGKLLLFVLIPALWNVFVVFVLCRFVGNFKPFFLLG